MDRNTMKNTIKSLKLWVLGCVMLFAGVQSASAALTGCEGTVYFKLPDGWKSAYAVAGGQGAAFSKSTTINGWYEVSTAKIGGVNSATGFVIEETGKNDCGSGHCVRKDSMNVLYLQLSDNGVNAFTCKDFSDAGELWIQAHPDPSKANITYYSADPPDVKYFYVFLPDNKIWKSSVPMINENGKDREMDIDSKNCGWYFRRYIDEELPTKVYIHRDDDEGLTNAIGMGGEGAATIESMDLKSLFEVFSAEPGYDGNLYFVADQKKAAELPSIIEGSGLYIDMPAITGSCSYKLAARIYDTDAQLHPAFSCYGGPSDHKPHEKNPDHDACQAPGNTAAQGVDKKTALVAIYECLGVTPGLVESTLDKATKKPKLSATGKKCFIDEKYFNQLFNYTEGVNEVTCFDMPFERADDGKWEFDSDFYTSNGVKGVQGGFYPVEETDEDKLKDADSTQKAQPLARTKRAAEGPVFYGPDLRALHPTEKIPLIDTYCNGAGWDGGYKCDGLFFDGDGTTEQISSDLKLGGLNQQACVFGWSCPDKAPAGWAFFVDGTETSAANGSPRWSSKEKSEDPKSLNGGRNQHFCFESHANFRFKKGLKFSFRGDDDIWVFIDNKLAVDLGGTHLAAPGYVDLDKFMPNGVPDSTYDIDIFFCDRRTTMSNVRIKTNMFIEQTVGIQAFDHQNSAADLKSTGYNEFKLSYSQSGGGSCAAQMGSTVILEGDAIVKAGYKISYMFTRDKSGSDPTKTIISEEDFEKDPVQLNGIFDVTNPGNPRINESKLKKSLSQGWYYLRIKIGTDVFIMEWEVKGSVGVANRAAVIVDANGVSGPVMPFKSSAMATNSNPTIDQMIPIYIAPITDACGGTTPCAEPLKLSPSVGDGYTLEIKDASGNSTNKAIFYKMENGQLTLISKPTAARKIGASGVDTLYVTMPYAEFSTSNEEKITINTKDNSYKAELSFFVPKLMFVEDFTSMKIIDRDGNTTTHMKGTPVLFNLIAVNPVDSTACGEACNFTLTSGSQTSKGLVVPAGSDSVITVENGRASFYVVSQMEYVRNDDGSGTATLHVVGDSPLMQGLYYNLQFINPPVPTPVFADIYDVHGEVSTSAMNIPTPFFDPQQEYLDGIGDSLVIYYARNFYNNPDSIPQKIAVFWDTDEKDSVIFEKEEIAKGVTCGAAAGLDDTLCLKRITLGGKKLSKKMKTGGVGKLRSWAIYTSRGVVTPHLSESVVYDRIAPIIVGARTTTESTGGVDMPKMKIEFSEPVKKTAFGVAEGDKVFSFYINNGKERQFAEYLALAPGFTVPEATNDNVMTLRYSATSMFPQSGDYIHFRTLNNAGLVMDQSEYDKYPGCDTIRPAEDATHNWNAAPGYLEVDGRVPSPWALVSGEVQSYVVRLIPSALGGIPRTPEESAALDPFDIFTYDANKDDEQFRNEILAGQGEFAKYAYIPHGWFAKIDMGAIVESKEDYVDANKENVFIDFKLDFFTNLGSHVATYKKRIFCDDAKNVKVNGKSFFGGTNCVENRRNFFVLWNMKSDKNRLVGSGAYVSKLETYVQLDNHGKKSKFEKTEMWGVRHNARTFGSLQSKLK